MSNVSEEDAVEADQDMTEWVAHPYTRNLLAQTKTKEAAAMSSLLNACAGSTDLRIAQKWGEWKQLNLLGELLRNGKAGR